MESDVFYVADGCLLRVFVAVAEWLRRPMQAPGWLRSAPTLKHVLIVLGLGLLLLRSGGVISRGLWLAWEPLARTDLNHRFDEWRLFQAGIYPSTRLATAAQRAIPHLRTTVYLPWALPLFGLLFAGGGLIQGRLITQGLSLLALALIASIGWRTLSPWGAAAGWLGALAPMAIAGNTNCLGHPHFGMLCMGLISLQWWLQKRGHPVPAGLCWALAMLKPQIAAPFVLTLSLPGQRRGLACGLALLASLAGIALLHTHTSPVAFLASWLRVLPVFVGSGNVNLLAWLLAPVPAVLVWIGLVLLAGAGITAMLLLRQPGEGSRPRSASDRRGFPSLPHAGRALGDRCLRVVAWCDRIWRQDPLSLAGVLAVVAQLGFYHNHYDNILLFPALLVCWRRLLQRPTVFAGLLTGLMVTSLWTPERLLERLPAHSALQAAIWLLLGITLICDLRAGCRQEGTLAGPDG